MIGDKYKDEDRYWAATEPDVAVEYLIGKAEDWFHNNQLNHYIEKIRRSWSAYHGNYYETGHEISFGGEQGELVNLAVNHYRNIGQHMLNMVTSTRPSFQARSINTDRKSVIQAKLANGLLDYYMREKRLERELKLATEYAIVLGSGYVKMEWNATKGEIKDYIEPDPDNIADYDEDGNPLDDEGNILEAFPIYEGDVEFKTLSPYDVVFDSTKETPEQHNWLICRTFLNKYDLAKKYPEYKDEILALETKDVMDKSVTSLTPYDKTTDIPVYEFFHKKTEALPEGRYMLYLDKDITLIDTKMPYRDLPVFRIAPANMLGTPYGYTTMWDLLPIQDALNSLYSTVLTNQNAFGVQNILNPRGNDIKVNQLEGSLNFIEYNAQVGKPEALQLTQTPGEIFNFMQMLERLMETISAVNSVVRGNPESSLKSGNALALVQSQALQFISGLQQSYIQLLEDTGTGLINMLKDFARVPRVAAIAGINNRSKMKEFSSDDLTDINRVVVDVGNALAQCLAEDTPVMMADGSTKMSQHILVGDLVMGPDSKPRTVNQVNSGKEPMYRICPKDKNRKDLEFKCNESHILTLRYCSDDSRYNVKKGDEIDISVRDYLELPERHKRLLQGFTTGVDFEEAPLEVPAYILGAWLGDGTSATTALTTMDDEIYNEWSKYAASINMQIRIQETKNNSTTYFITSGKAYGKSNRNPMMNELRAMEVINNKHIPNVYLKNSIENRLQLLAGLLDTDGSLLDNTFVFTQKNERLADDVVYLAKSLGFKVTKKLVERTYNDKNADIFKIVIGGDTHKIPTRLPRKQATKKDKQKNWSNFGICVEPLGMGTYYGFTLKEEPHFVLGNFVVTHNTTAGRVQMAEQLLQMGLITSPEQYINVINTGNLDLLTEKESNELDTIKGENEFLLKGEEVMAVATDDHALHIREHKAVIADQDLRKDPALVERTLAHIMEHIQMLQTVDPNLLAIIGEQPLSPPGGSPVAPGNAAPQQPPASAQGVSQGMQNPNQAGAIAVGDQLQNLPEPARPAGDPNQPISPEEAMALQSGGNVSG
jgi:hypothetical protein